MRGTATLSVLFRGGDTLTTRNAKESVLFSLVVSMYLSFR